MLIARAPVRVSFAGGGTDLESYYGQFGGMVVSAAIDKYFYAFDKNTGREIWRAPVPYEETAVPMTYRTRSGRQFVVMATGEGADNALVAFALGGQ